MKRIILINIILTLIFSFIVFPKYVEASEGLPGSAKFGYGARIDINGENLDEVIESASYIGLDWVAINFDWGKMWPDPGMPPSINDLTELITQAHQRDISVLLTISNPAQWAITDRGPDPQTTANLVLSLVDFYSEKVLAVELFPGVNTVESWRVDPNASDYLNALKTTQEMLTHAGKQVALVTTLTPEAFTPSPADIDDQAFLSSLYQAGGKPYLAVLGIKYNKITGDPLSNPSTYVLRHYEEIRSTMLSNDHSYGTIWITGFRVPTDDRFNDLHSYQSPGSTFEQSTWIEDAYKLMRAQLYIGAAFFDQVNSNPTVAVTNLVTIISNGTTTNQLEDSIRGFIENAKHNVQTSNSDSTHVNQDELLSKDNNNNNFLLVLLRKLIEQLSFTHP